MKKILYILPFLFLSCSVFQKSNVGKTNKFDENISKLKNNISIEIGSIGTVNKMFSKEYQTNAYPILNQKIRISVLEKYFDKSSMKLLKKVKVIDSSNTPTKYIEFKIIDKVTLLEELNAVYNTGVFEYLKNSEDSFFVNAVSSWFPNDISLSLINAEEVYLRSNSNNDFVIDLFKNEEIIESFHFSKGIVFDFKTTHFCWSENDKKSIVISNIGNGKCSKKNYNTYYKALKNKKEFKF